MVRLATVLVSACALSAGCFGPPLVEGQACTESGKCPEGQTCDTATMTCWGPGNGPADGGADATPGADAAPPDAALPAFVIEEWTCAEANTLALYHFAPQQAMGESCSSDVTLDLVNGPIMSAGGPPAHNSGIELNGVNQRAEFTYPSQDIDNAFTLDVWVHPTSVTVGAGIVSSYVDGLQQFSMTQVAGGAVAVSLSADGNNTAAQLTTLTPIQLNVWTHLRFVYNGSANSAQIYVNGYPDNTTNARLQLFGGGVRTAQIGVDVPDGLYFAGRIDAVRISSIAR